ncbi:cupredoxin domain-containing protein [Fodinibius salsisoli]|uniref:Blue (type 1) copper domain-containing protein n=1 Tax=Fodinibius salsisoli TaxID=2820877 RepID=A0ABT3PSD7_9BACT|nr:plastocyanin/azurin family copper-binding protein [Fodinibius salsisoli]MCW9708772.1 hypothetical protein [Fodinibius salsisoli]
MQKYNPYIISLLFVLSFLLLAFTLHYHAGSAINTQQIDSTEIAATVEMTNTMKFNPDTVIIKNGQTVQWKNSSLLAHSVTGDPSQATIKGSATLPKGADSFDSGMMDPDQTYQHTFSLPGTYQYFCIPHEGAKMYGWIIVEELSKNNHTSKIIIK